MSLRAEDQSNYGPIDSFVNFLADKYGITEDCILLRWQMDKGFLVVTTSSKESRLKNYLRTADFKLTTQESFQIDLLGSQQHWRAYMIGEGKFDPACRD